MVGGKQLIPPTNLQESNNEESWSTNNNGSSYAELLPPPPSLNHEANGTFGPTFIDPYLNEFQDSYPGFDATFAPEHHKENQQTEPLPLEPQLVVMKKHQ